MSFWIVLPAIAAMVLSGCSRDKSAQIDGEERKWPGPCVEQTKAANGLQSRTDYVYDDMGALTRLTESVAARRTLVVEFERGADGRLLNRTTDIAPIGNIDITTAYIFNAQGLPIEARTKSEDRETFKFYTWSDDRLAAVKRQVVGRESREVFTRNSALLVERIERVGRHDSTREYDELGRLIAQRNDKSVTEYRYLDRTPWFTEIVGHEDGKVADESDLTYDKHGNLLRRVDEVKGDEQATVYTYECWHSTGWQPQDRLWPGSMGVAPLEDAYGALDPRWRRGSQGR